jgi:hypothetical protein
VRGFKPSKRIWEKVNAAILNENVADTLVTLISGMCSLLVSTGVCADESHARVHLAALVPLLQAEFARLGDGKWIT